MSVKKCPKCGKSQPAENTECIQCGVIFRKLTAPKSKPEPAPKPVQQIPPDPPESEIKQDDFFPEIGLKNNIEIIILNVFAYIYLILGIGAGIGIIIQGKNDFSLFLGIIIISADLVTSMLIFVFCTITKKIISIDNTLFNIINLLQAQK